MGGATNELLWPSPLVVRTDGCWGAKGEEAVGGEADGSWGADGEEEGGGGLFAPCQICIKVNGTTSDQRVEPERHPNDHRVESETGNQRVEPEVPIPTKWI